MEYSLTVLNRALLRNFKISETRAGAKTSATAKEDSCADICTKWQRN